MRLFRWYYKLRAMFRAWNYKRKYGISIDEAMLEYGRRVELTPEKKDHD